MQPVEHLRTHWPYNKEYSSAHNEQEFAVHAMHPKLHFWHVPNER